MLRLLKSIVRPQPSPTWELIKAKLEPECIKEAKESLRELEPECVRKYREIFGDGKVY